MLKMEIEPQFVPRTINKEDVSNIDKMFTRESPRETPEDQNHSKLVARAKFDNFTFIEDTELETSFNT